MQTIIQEKFITIGSTHSYASTKNNLEKGKIYVISAQSQNSGIGRRMKCWCSPKGNLYMTLIYESHKLGQLSSLVLCYTICKIVEDLDVKLEYKWPNDLLYKNKKLCGIISLVKDNWDILSCGLNVNTHVQSFICLREIIKEKIDLDALRDRIVGEFLENLKTIQIVNVIDFLNARLAYKGQLISYELDKNTYIAKLISVEMSGSLLVQKNARIERLINACKIRPYI